MAKEIKIEEATTSQGYDKDGPPPEPRIERPQRVPPEKTPEKMKKHITDSGRR